MMKKKNDIVEKNEKKKTIKKAQKRGNIKKRLDRRGDVWQNISHINRYAHIPMLYRQYNTGAKKIQYFFDAY